MHFFPLFHITFANTFPISIDFSRKFSTNFEKFSLIIFHLLFFFLFLYIFFLQILRKYFSDRHYSNDFLSGICDWLLFWQKKLIQEEDLANRLFRISLVRKRWRTRTVLLEIVMRKFRIIWEIPQPMQLIFLETGWKKYDLFRENHDFTHFKCLLTILVHKN